MPNPKETAEVDIGGQKVTLVRGDTPQEEWDTRLAKLAAKGVKAVKEAVPQAIDQTLRASPVGPLYGLVESSGRVMSAAKGQPTSNPLENVGTAVTGAVTTAGDVTGVATGLGKEIVGQVQENPQMIAEGKAQLNKNISDLTGQPETPPPPPAYPEAEPIDAAQPSAQPAPSTPVVKQSQKPSAEHLTFTKTQDEITQRFKKSEESAKAADAALTADTALREKALKDEHSLALDAEALRLERAQIQSEAMTKAQEVRDSWMSRQNQLIELSRQAAADPIDPNRYWNNKDIGQKVSAVIAGALFGFTGQGMQWLQRLDSLVAQDMQAQSADRASKVAGLDKAAAQAGSIAEKAMRMGAEDAEARTLDKIAKLENIKARIEMLGKDTSNSEVRVRNEMMRSQLDEKLNGEYVKFENLREAKANGAAERSFKRAQLGIMAAKQGMGAGRPLNEGQQQKISELLNSASAVSNMWADYSKMAGSTGSGALSVLPAAASDAANWNKNIAMQHVQFIGKPLEGGVVRESDTKRYRENFVPDAWDAKNVAMSKTESLIKYSTSKYRNEIDSLRAAGYNISGLPTPEAFEADMRAKTFGGKSAIPASAMEEVQ